MLAYGPRESGRLWYSTFYLALTVKSGFKRARYDSSLCYKQKGREMLALVVEVDGHLYAGMPTISKQSETFLQDHFKVGTFESGSFDIIVAKQTQQA